MEPAKLILKDQQIAESCILNLYIKTCLSRTVALCHQYSAVANWASHRLPHFSLLSAHAECCSCRLPQLASC